MEKKKTGRPSKLTPEIQDRICMALKAGNFRQAAAKWVGVSWNTFLDWMRGNEAFRAAVMEAEGSAEVRAVGLVSKAAEKDAKHAEWWLTHRQPGRWAEQTRVRAELVGKGGGPIHTTDLTREEILRVIKQATIALESETPGPDEGVE